MGYWPTRAERRRAKEARAKETPEERTARLQRWKDARRQEKERRAALITNSWEWRCRSQAYRQRIAPRRHLRAEGLLLVTACGAKPKGGARYVRDISKYIDCRRCLKTKAYKEIRRKRRAAAKTVVPQGWGVRLALDE